MKLCTCGSSRQETTRTDERHIVVSGGLVFRSVMYTRLYFVPPALRARAGHSVRDLREMVPLHAILSHDGMAVA